MESGRSRVQAFSEAVRRIRLVLTIIMGVLATAVIAIVPGFSLYTEYVTEKASLGPMTNNLANGLSEFIARYPDVWDIMDARLLDIINIHACPDERCLIELKDPAGQLIVSDGIMPSWPVLVRHEAVTDGFDTAGQLTYHLGMSSALITAVVSSLVGIILSYGLFMAFLWYPKRLVNQALQLIERGQEEVEAQLFLAEQAQKEAETATKAKSEFLATISHELRTPLTAIKGSLGLIRGLKTDDVSVETTMLLEMAEKNSDALLVLINELLDFEKLNAGSIDIDLGTYDVVQLTRDLVAANHGFAMAYSVKFVFREMQANTWAQVDKNHFNQILRNLLSNAAKFSKAGGIVEISVLRKDTKIRVRVRDYGVGIPQTHKTTIFNRFTQVDGSDTRAKGGTGLGLSISKTLVEAMGGSISFESQVGVGSIFYVDLQAVDAPGNAELVGSAGS